MAEPTSDAELRKLALDWLHGQVFTSEDVREHDLLPMVFLPLTFMTEADVEALKKLPAGMFYEYISKAGPSAINGMPIFMSMNVLSVDDTRRLFTFYNEARELARAFLKGSNVEQKPDTVEQSGSGV